MKKIIRMGLLSTVGFFNLICGASSFEPNEGDVVVMGIVATDGIAQGEVMGAEDHQRAQRLRMIEDIQSGGVPDEILELFAGLPKIDVSKLNDPEALHAMFISMQNELSARLNDEGIRYLNVVLQSSVSSRGSLLLLPSIPLAHEFFGEMKEEITAETFFVHLSHAYHTLFSDSTRIISANINTSADWATVQFLGLFFDNAINSLRFNIHAPGLGSRLSDRGH